MWQLTWRCGSVRVRKLNGVGSGVARLLGELRPVDRPPIEPRRRAGLQPASAQAQLLQRLAQQHRRRLATAAGRIVLLATMDQAIQKCAGGDYNCAGVDHAAVTELDADDARQFLFGAGSRELFLTADSRLPTARCRAQHDIDHLRLLDEEARLRLQHLAHLYAVLLLVALRSRRPHRRAARGVQQAELNAHRVGDLAHDAAQRVDLAHQVALGDAADGRVAAHLRDQVQVQREQRGAQSHARRGHGRLAAGMTRADDDNVILLCEDHWGRTTSLSYRHWVG